MANLRKVAEELAAHGQYDLAREVANLSLQVKQAGGDYAVDLMTVLFVPARKNVPFNRDVLDEIYQTFIPVKGTDTEAMLHPVDSRGAGIITRTQEDQGYRAETIVTVRIPKGHEQVALKALVQVGRRMGFTVEPATTATKPTFRQVAQPVVPKEKPSIFRASMETDAQVLANLLKSKRIALTVNYDADKQAGTARISGLGAVEFRGSGNDDAVWVEFPPFKLKTTGGAAATVISDIRDALKKA